MQVSMELKYRVRIRDVRSSFPWLNIGCLQGHQHSRQSQYQDGLQRTYSLETQIPLLQTCTTWVKTNKTVSQKAYVLTQKQTV